MVDYLSCLDKALVETLKNKELTITTAESCTGGMVASSIVNISGASDIFKEESEQCICIYYQFTLLYCFYFGLYGSGSFFFAVKNRKVMKRASEISGKDAKMNVRKIMEFMETFSAPGIKNSLNNCRSQIKENCRCRDFAGTFFEKSVELLFTRFKNSRNENSAPSSEYFTSIAPSGFTSGTKHIAGKLSS